jgi:hypothetical protein
MFPFHEAETPWGGWLALLVWVVCAVGAIQLLVP